MRVAGICPHCRDLFFGQPFLEIACRKIKGILNGFFQVNLQYQVHAALQVKSKIQTVRSYILTYPFWCAFIKSGGQNDSRNEKHEN